MRFLGAGKFIGVPEIAEQAYADRVHTSFGPIDLEIAQPPVVTTIPNRCNSAWHRRVDGTDRRTQKIM